MKMYEYQDKIPILPVPSLKDTIYQYLESIEPILEKEAYIKSKKIALDFFENEGSLLQDRLLEYRQTLGKKSWLREYSKERFLSIRSPLSIVGNFSLEFNRIDTCKEYGYLEFVTLLIHSIGKLYVKIVKKELEPMIIKGTSYCMSQYKGILGCVRIPQKDMDIYQIYKPYKEVNSFGVFYRNRYYILRLLDDEGRILDYTMIYNTLKQIYSNKEKKLEVNYNTTSFGGSKKAHIIFNELLRDEANRANIKLVNQSMFHIALKDDIRKGCDFNDILYTNTEDIYLYKPWSISVFTDKVCIFNNEHTYADGISNIYLYTKLIAIMKSSSLNLTSNSEAVKFHPIHFNINNKVYSKLKMIRKEYVSDVSRFGSLEYIRKEVNFRGLKKYGISADALIQLSFHYAQLKTYGEMRFTHESISVAHYYEGRTSCVRSVSKDSVNFIKGLIDKRLSADKKLELLQKASKTHSKKIENAKRFICFIRHSAGLKYMYELYGKELGMEKLPKIFADKNFRRFCSQELSTSTVGNSYFINAFAYAPVVKDGLGLGYIMLDDGFKTIITYYKSQEDTVKVFVEALDDFFDKI